MSTGTSQRSGFRQWEVGKLFGWGNAGESASIVGISGVGKSNLFNHLQDPAVQADYQDDPERQLIIIRANFHYIPDFSDRSIYSLILEQFELLSEKVSQLNLPDNSLELINNYHEALLDAGNDVLKVQRYFKQALRVLLGNNQHRLIILCDQFDEVAQEAEPHLFANLRGLRETYKYRLSFFLFTRDLFPNLVELDEPREEFYELMASNLLGLGPYDQTDAASLLQRVAKRNQTPLSTELSQRLYSLTGGHAGLLRATYLSVVQNDLLLTLDEDTAVTHLLQRSAVELECDKIWRSLSTREWQALANYAHNLRQDDADKRIENLLKLKGVLTDSEDPQFFSPIFARFVLVQEPLWEQPVYFDKAARQIWVLGKPVPSLTKLEFRLFSKLYDSSGEVVEKGELIDQGWPEAQGGVSDEALVAAIARLRKKIEPDSKNPRFLENVHNQGYILNVEVA